jgi:1-deoxy-D-xylulose-5-phosphate synthase
MNMVVLEKIKCSADLKQLNNEQLNVLADELRQEILRVVSANGGHLASNLGVVELTVALHYFLDLDKDEIVWDVGHQCYAHKLLSGRQAAFATLRQFGGLSGFPKPHESRQDAYVAGHSSTSISVAVGISQAACLLGEDKRVFAVIGDGAMSGGMVYEALNHGGYLKTPFTVILNDNEMSIAENVGAMSHYLTRLRANKRYRHLKDRITRLLLQRHNNLGEHFYYGLERLRDAVKYFLVRGVLFEEMGFVYLGPVDGHNISDLLETMRLASQIEKPVLIHVITKKGKGYKPAEDNPTAFHGVGSFDLATGKTKPKNPGYTDFFSKRLLELAEQDSRIVGITAAMPHGTGLEAFKQRFPERFYDVGIAEQHMLTFAGALALRGLRPVVAVYSTFLQRAYDQLVQDICMAEAPVVVCVDRAGIVGEDGETHQGLFDLSMLLAMPNMTVLAPRDGASLENMLDFALALNRPVALRYPRGEAPTLAEYPPQPLEFGRGEVLRQPEGAELGILTLGDMTLPGLQLADLLAEKGIEAALADLRFAKPLDKELVCDFAKKYGRLLIMEDGVQSGGVGENCLAFLQAANIQAEVELASFPDVFVPQGKPQQLFELHGLTSELLCERVCGRWFGSKQNK